MNNAEKIALIQTIVAEKTNIPLNLIQAVTRRADAVKARHLSMYFCRFHTMANLKEISLAHGKRNHATVIHACSSVTSQKKFSTPYKDLYDSINTQIKATLANEQTSSSSPQ